MLVRPREAHPLGRDSLGKSNRTIAALRVLSIPPHAVGRDHLPDTRPGPVPSLLHVSSRHFSSSSRETRLPGQTHRQYSLLPLLTGRENYRDSPDMDPYPHGVFSPKRILRGSKRTEVDLQVPCLRIVMGTTLLGRTGVNRRSNRTFRPGSLVSEPTSFLWRVSPFPLDGWFLGHESQVFKEDL